MFRSSWQVTLWRLNHRLWCRHRGSFERRLDAVRDAHEQQGGDRHAV